MPAEKALLKHQEAYLRDQDSHNDLHRVHEIAHAREHESTEKAILKAEESLAQRLEAMNEFREQITTERGDYVRREEYDAVKKLVYVGLGIAIMLSLFAPFMFQLIQGSG